MQRKWMLTLLTGLLLLLSVVSVSAHGDLEGVDAIFISGAWARPTVMEAMAMPEATPEAGGMGGMDHSSMGGMDMGGVSGAYLTIQNMGEATVRLVAVSSPVAAMVSIHETTIVDNVAQMNPVEGGLTIEHGAVVALEPGGLHLMLENLLMPLVADTAIQMTLTFETLGADGNPTGDPLNIVVGALVQMFAPETGSMLVQGAWARPTVAAMDMGDMASTPESPMSMSDVSAVYLVLRNEGEAEDRLVSASSPAAGLVEIHESKMVDNVMQMNPVEGGIVLPVEEGVRLQPGGLHIMLLELTMPLVPGTAIPVTLNFESGASLTIAAPIYDGMMAGM
jgi:copper(I)-binding protein